MNWTSRILLVVAFSLGLAPIDAEAATPFTVADSGERPSVAVGSDGSGHVVWTDQGSSDKVGYCRVAAGAESCNRTELLSFGGAPAAQSSGQAKVFVPAPGKVVIVSSCTQCPSGDVSDNTFKWTSTDNGSSFGSPQQIGTGFATHGSGTWLDSVNIWVGISATRVKATSSPLAGDGVQYAGGLSSFSPEVAKLAHDPILVAASNDLDQIHFGVYDGTLSVAGINNSLLWARIDSVVPSPSGSFGETALNSGEAGLYLSYLESSPGAAHVALRRFDPDTYAFGAPTYLNDAGPIDGHGIGSLDSFQDPAGRISVIWTSTYDGGRLRYRVSDASGANFSPTANLAAHEAFNEPEVATGNGTGFATWTHGAAGAVRVVPLDPHPEPVTPPPPPAAGGGDRPAVSDLGIGDRTLRPGQRTTFRFKASGPGQAVLTIDKRVKGLKGNRRGKRVCRPATRKRLRALRREAGSRRAYRKLLKRRSCRAWRRIGRIRQVVHAGENAIPFNGRVAGRKLGRGSYRAKLTITDSAGQISRTETLKFRVVGKKKPHRRGHKHRAAR